jgi:hypothetical protein
MVAMPSMSRGESPAPAIAAVEDSTVRSSPGDAGLAPDARNADPRDDRATLDDVAHAANPTVDG